MHRSNEINGNFPFRQSHVMHPIDKGFESFLLKHGSSMLIASQLLLRQTNTQSPSSPRGPAPVEVAEAVISTLSTFWLC